MVRFRQRQVIGARQVACFAIAPVAHIAEVVVVVDAVIVAHHGEVAWSARRPYGSCESWSSG